MNKLMISVLTAGSMIAMAASAGAVTATDTVTGTVNITGTVSPKCMVVSGTSVSSTFGANVDLEELADTDGTLLDSGTLEARFASSGGTGLSAKVVCTSAAPAISVNAEAIKADTATAVTGYADTINYEANVAVTTVNSTTSYDDDSADGVGSGPVALDGRLANQSTNVVISASDFRTDADTDLLVADDYTGKITVEIAPSV